MASTAAGPVQRAMTAKLTAALAPLQLEVENESYKHAGPPGSESHFKVLVVSAAFDGVPLLERHRLVHAALAEELKPGGVHALSISAKTPAQMAAAGGRVVAPATPPCLGGSKGAAATDGAAAAAPGEPAGPRFACDTGR
jgi:BolA protein